MVVSPNRGPNWSFIVSGMSELIVPLNVTARMRALPGARARRTRSGPLKTRSRIMPPAVSVERVTSMRPMPLSRRIRPLRSLASITPRRTSTSQAWVSDEIFTVPSKTRTACTTAPAGTWTTMPALRLGSRPSPLCTASIRSASPDSSMRTGKRVRSAAVGARRTISTATSARSEPMMVTSAIVASTRRARPGGSASVLATRSVTSAARARPGASSTTSSAAAAFRVTPRIII